jgi:hypothetical protein
MLTGNRGEYRQLVALVDRQDDSIGYSALLTGAFFEAVNRRFGKKSAKGDVIEFVADVRSRLDEVAETVDPRVAERLIREVLGDGSTRDVPGRASATAKLFLLAALVADEGLDGAGLDEFMAKSRKLADHLLG